MRKSILFLIPTLGGGGAERVLVNLVNNLNQKEFDITVQTIFKAGVNADYLNKEIQFIEGKIKQFKGNIHLMKLFSPPLLYKWIVGKRYDIVVSYLEGPSTRIVSGCSHKDTKLVAWVHVEQHTPKGASNSYRLFSEAKNVYNKFDHIVCVAETVKKDFLSIFSPKCPVSVIYNTNEDQKILAQSRELIDDFEYPEGLNLFSVGRLVPEKGYDRLIDIHKRLLDDNIPHHIFVLGDGGIEHTQKVIEDKGVAKTFHLLGFKKNPYKYVSKADLFVCSSFREGFSTAVTEALILGVPVISTNVSGAQELLGENNDYGIITALDDDSLYQSIKTVLTDIELLSYYKQKAIERGKVFSKENAVNTVVKLFNSLS